MWSDMAEIAIDVFAPTPGSNLDVDSLFDKKNPDQLRVPLVEAEGFKRRLNLSGWFDEEIVAGGLLEQGKAQSLLSLATGWALVEMVKARRSKSLPREFCIAVTPTRVIALALNRWSEASGGDVATDVVVKVKREEVGSWPRGSVRVDRDTRNLKGGMRGGTLDLAGLEQVPVNWGSSAQTEEVVALLERG